MIKIYLTDNERQAIVVRNLQIIDKYCCSLALESAMEPLGVKERNAVQCIHEYCQNELKTQLKKCEFFAKLSDKEAEAEFASHKDSFITRAATGTYCVFAEKQAEEVLAEFQRLNICKTIQKALKTGKNILLVVL